MRRFLLHITLGLLIWQASTLFAEPAQTETHINRVHLLSAHLTPVALNHSKDSNLIVSQYTHRAYRISGGFVFTGWVGFAEENSSNVDECHPCGLTFS